jgi:tetratricopeptide (TPR) repeat protein
VSYYLSFSWLNIVSIPKRPKINNRISGIIQRIFRFLYVSSLAFCLVCLFSGSGSAKRCLGKKPVPEKTWRCNKEADDAMKRHDYEAGILLHHRLLEKEPANGLALYHLGYAYGQTGDHVKEVVYYEKAVDLGFNEDHIFFNMGTAYGELRQIENSIRAFRKALDVNPASAENHFGLALAYQVSVADNLAEKEFLEAIKIDPAHVDARLYLSLLYTDMGELEKAREQLREILEIDPAHPGAREFLERIEKE